MSLVDLPRELFKFLVIGTNGAEAMSLVCREISTKCRGIFELRHYPEHLVISGNNYSLSIDISTQVILHGVSRDRLEYVAAMRAVFTNEPENACRSYCVTKYRGEYRFFRTFEMSVIAKFRRAFEGFYRICAIMIKNPKSATTIPIEQEHVVMGFAMVILEPIAF